MTQIRKAIGLIWARQIPRPAQIPHSRPRRGSAKAEGLRFERELAEAMPSAKHGLWWEFQDSNGHGWCQTDLTILGDGVVLVIEVKLSWVPEAQEKLSGLYLPVVEAATRQRVIGVVAVRRLVAGVRAPIARDLASAVQYAKTGLPVVWHSPGPVHQIGNSTRKAA